MTKATMLKQLRKAQRLMREAGVADLPKVSKKYSYKEMQSLLREVKPTVRYIEAERKQARINRRRERFIETSKRQAERKNREKVTRLVERISTAREKLIAGGINKENVPSMLDDYTRFTPSELKDILEQMTPQKAQSMVNVTPREQISETRKNVAEIERQVANRIIREEKERAKGLETTVHGEPTGLTRGEMGDIRQKAMEYGEFRADRGFANWEKHEGGVKAFFERTTAKAYKENYIKALLFQYGKSAYNLINAIEKTDDRTFLDYYYTEEDVSVDYFYDLDDANAYLGYLEDVYARLGMEIEDNDEYSDEFERRQMERLQPVTDNYGLQMV